MAASPQPAGPGPQCPNTRSVSIRRARVVQVVMAATALGLVTGLLSGCSADDSVRVLKEAPYSALVHGDPLPAARQQISGIVGRNAAGCVTVGRAVVVLPARSYLHFDGSITVQGHEYPQGQLLAGIGTAQRVNDSTCGNDVDYLWIKRVTLTPA